MKKLFQSVLFVAVAAMAFSSCSKDQETATPQNQGFELNFTVDNQTRTTLGTGDVITWIASDRVGLYITTTPAPVEPNSNKYAKVDLTKNPVLFTTYLKTAPNIGDPLYTYYPYSGSNYSAPSTAVGMSIPATQKQSTANVFNGENNPMVGIPVALTSNALTGVCYPAIKFRQLGSMIEFHLYCTNSTLATEKVQSVAFAANKALAGSFTFNIETVTAQSDLTLTNYTETTATTVLDASASLGADKATASKVYMVVAPGSYSGVITIVTDKASYTLPVSTAKTFERAHIKALGIDLAKATRKDKPASGEVITLTNAEIAGLTAQAYGPFAFTNSFGEWAGHCGITVMHATNGSYLQMNFKSGATSTAKNSRIIVPELGKIVQKIVVEMAPNTPADRYLCITAPDYTYPVGAKIGDLEAAAKVQSAKTTSNGETITIENMDHLKLTRFAIFPAGGACYVKSIAITVQK
ncbi:MAG: fimbrillin family protein [Alistipes sp.]